MNAPPGAPQPPSLRWLRQAVCIFAGLLCLLDAHAHLMVAQRGTLNLVGDGGYLVLSVPVSALRGFDDDGDGLMSGPELQAHAPAIRAQLVDGVQMLGNTGAVTLEGLLMTLSPADDRPDAPARQVVMLGRFTVSPDAVSYRLRVTLFGTAADENQIDLVVTRQAEKQLIRLHRGNDTQAVLPGRLAVLAEAFVMGLEHIASGPDHMLFLLVVVSAGWGLGPLLLALTCFTAGHGLTLAAVAWAGISAPAALVETAIAATIVGMALFDAWSRRQAGPVSAWWRLLLVFLCALIHGLGLAGALTALQLDSGHLLLTLAGFNLGIESAQVLIASAALALLALIRAVKGPDGERMAMRLTSVVAVVAGSLWFVQRAVQIA